MEADVAIDRLSRLRRALVQHLGDNSVQVTSFRQGVDCFVDLVVTAGGRPAVVRSAKVERRMTTYEGLVDFGEVLAKEVATADLLAAASIPTPRLLAWHRADGGTDDPSWMLSELVEHEPIDVLPPSAQHDLGTIARRIHAITPAGSARQTLAPGGEWEPWIVDRILQRLNAARTYMTLPSANDIAPRLARAVRGRAEHATRLLHLDLRAPNTAVVDGRIVAVLDCANALCGDPYLELARIRQCDLMTEEFLNGYGLKPAEVAAHEQLLRAYSLDVTALLVAVSTEELDDPTLQNEMAARTMMLVRELMSES